MIIPKQRRRGGRTAIITMRVTPGIKDALRKQAKQDGKTLTSFILDAVSFDSVSRGMSDGLSEQKV